MERKTTLRMLALLAILICSIVTPILVQRFMVRASKSGYDPDYMTVSGVLSTDSYVLFPFQKKNLTIGFSKYGEMIDYETKVGLNYGDETDAFAPGESKVTEAQWVEGWIINITYVQGGEYKNVWARATYSDYYSGTAGIGGDWIEDATDGSTGTTYRGGRKTNGGAVTDAIKVLYDGPRRFVALLNTAIYDSSAHTTGLVNLTFTIVFNKVEKQVIVFKDIKRTDVGKNIGDMQIEFSNRGQWDLGSGTPPKSYAHFYEDQSTLYDGHYQAWYNATGIPSNYNGTYDVCQVIDDGLDYVAWAAHWPKPIIGWVGATQIEANRIVILSSTSTKTQVQNGTGAADISLTETPISYPQKNATGIFWKEEPMVFVNNQFKIINGTVTATKVTYFEGNNTLKFPSGYEPGSTDVIKIVYKYSTEQDDMSAEPNSPFVIAEWAFMAYEATDMFRAVSLYGITDLNDGEDSNCASHDENKLDAEVQYYLNATFNPYDLYSAVYKDTRRWVYFHNVTSAEVTAERVTFNLTQKPVIKPDDWTEYCNWAEKIEWGGALKTPYRASSLFGGYNYTFYRDSSDGTGNVTITGDNVPSAGTIIKVLYSTNATWQEEKTNLGTFGNTSRTMESDASVVLIPNTIINSTTWTDPFGATYNITILYDEIYAKQLSSRNSTASRTDDLQLSLDIKIRPESGYVKVHNSTYYYCDTTLYTTNTTFSGNMSIMFKVTPAYTTQTNRAKYKEHLHITGDILLRSNHTYVPTNTTYSVAIANYTVVYANLTTDIGGSYEWITLGKDAATIDSLGAAYVTEAFDSIKEIKVKAAGMDINDTSYGPYSPFVMAGSATGTKANYRDSLNRTFLRDDWCQYGTTPGYPISTSNMIFVGGPVAQMGTEYFNEFTDAFFARSYYVTNNTGCEEAHSNKILALSCWNRNVSAAGYAVIAIYKDLNGTIGLVIWGYDGQDTYYASKWFWDGLGGQPGIQYLQSVNRGVTAIVLKITYSTTDPLHPTVSVVERLGTISEKDQHDP